MVRQQGKSKEEWMVWSEYVDRVCVCAHVRVCVCTCVCVRERV